MRKLYFTPISSIVLQPTISYPLKCSSLKQSFHRLSSHVWLQQCYRDACLKFMDLWNKKHETGQWVEIEASEVMATQPNISAINDSGIMFANAANMPGTPENSGKMMLMSHSS